MIDLIIESKPNDLLPNEWIFCLEDWFDAHLYGAKALKKLYETIIMFFQERNVWSNEIQVLDISVFRPYAKEKRKQMQIYRRNFGNEKIIQ